jgi:hypothetical protein
LSINSAIGPFILPPPAPLAIEPARGRGWRGGIAGGNEDVPALQIRRGA